MNMRTLAKFALPLLFLVALFATERNSKPTTVHGYVIDSACAFTKGLTKPISPECATACGKAGSPLVILSSSGRIYWPIADTTPSSGQNDKLLPYAGKRVTVTGNVFQRGGSSAIVISKIEPLDEMKSEMKH